MNKANGMQENASKIAKHNSSHKEISGMSQDKRSICLSGTKTKKAGKSGKARSSWRKYHGHLSFGSDTAKSQIQAKKDKWIQNKKEALKEAQERTINEKLAKLTKERKTENLLRFVKHYKESDYAEVISMLDNAYESQRSI